LSRPRKPDDREGWSEELCPAAVRLAEARLSPDRGGPRSIPDTQGERFLPAICTNLLAPGHMRECSNDLGPTLRISRLRTSRRCGADGMRKRGVVLSRALGWARGPGGGGRGLVDRHGRANEGACQQEQGGRVGLWPTFSGVEESCWCGIQRSLWGQDVALASAPGVYALVQAKALPAGL